MLWMLPLAGAAAGALLNKKNPLQGALMGGALGATGGMLAPAAAGAAGTAGGAGGLLGAGGAGLGAGTTSALGSAGLTAGSQQAGMLAAQEAGMAGGGGLLGGLKTAASYAQPAMQGMQAATMAKGLMGQQQPMQAPQIMPQQSMGGQTLAALAQQGAQSADMTGNDAMKRRMMSQDIINRMMGRQYG